MADEDSTSGSVLISFIEAKARGLPRYFTGLPCSYGHVSERQTINTWCVKCRRESNRKFYKTHTTKCVERNKLYRKTYPERNRESGRKWRANNPEKARESSRKYMRKRNRAELLAYARKRAGMPEPLRPCPDTCECCGRGKGKRAFSLDHDHKTGAFRGWLCAVCNLGIGKLGDSIDGLLLALEYLKRAEAVQMEGIR